jgi:hypothetical protein
MKPVAQGGTGDAWQPPRDVIEVLQAVDQFADDEYGPAISENLVGFRDGAVLSIGLHGWIMPSQSLE